MFQLWKEGTQCRTSPKFSQGQTHKNLYCVEDQGHNYVVQDENDFEKAIFAIIDTLSQTLRTPMIKTPVVLEGKEREMELDTGAAISIVSHADYCGYCKSCRLLCRLMQIIVTTLWLPTTPHPPPLYKCLWC